MSMAATGANLPKPWEAVGRGTEVGRALFALYNGYGVARNRGNKYSDHNRMRIMERISAHGLPDLYYIPPDPPKPKKPAVKVPRFRKKYVTIDEIPQVLLMRGRRKGSQILTQLKKDMSQKDQLPQPKRPLLDEKEKARLQEIFEWSGRDVEDQDQAALDIVPRKPPPPRGSVEEQEMLIAAIAKEIEERKQFLDKMFELGRGSKYEPMIRLEIQERIRQIELLDKNISRMDKESLDGQALVSKKSSSQSKHVGMVEEERPLSQVSSRASNKTFKEQLECVRKETMALNGGAISRAMEGSAKDFEDSERGLSCSEKSFDNQSVSTTNNGKSRSKMGESIGQFQSPPFSVKTIENRSLIFSSKCDDDARSTASTNSSKCSSMQSGTIRSSLKSINFNTSIRSHENSSRHSLMSM